MKLQMLSDTAENKATSVEAQYKRYVDEHIANIQKGYSFIKDNIPEMLKDCNINELDKIFKNHDLSKYGEEEFLPYAEHFYGKMKGVKDDPAFEKAWKHHYENNSHHPEHWKGEEMPFEYIIEMICDWWAFSWKCGNLEEIFSFYKDKAKKDKEKKLHYNTQLKIEKYLLMLERFLNKEVIGN